MDGHRRAGRDLIIISSSGTDIVEPIGERLGVDIAIGTQVGVEDGKYTGEIIFYAYGEGKAEAMRALAAERGYDLAESFAYSDSITDVPMLDLVGHPFAVNPDTDLRRLAQERGWPIRDFAKPVALRRTIESRQVAVAGLGVASVALLSVAVGVAWYARRRASRGSA
jgi:phosphoserine phosphatase